MRMLTLELVGNQAEKKKKNNKKNAFWPYIGNILDALQKIQSVQSWNYSRTVCVTPPAKKQDAIV